jgi:hypothetical protein
MPQIQKQNVIAGMRIIGTAGVDGGAVSAEGGPLHPQLIIPLTVTLDARPADSTLALVWLRAHLMTTRDPTPTSLVCQPVSETLLDALPARSPVGRPSDALIALRFFLSAAELEALEEHRHASAGDPITLYLRLEAVAAAVRIHNQKTLDGAQEQSAWGDLGELSEVLPFWQTQIPPLTISVEQSRWVGHVLPALGYDRLRLVEVGFPPALPDHPGAALEWDKARRAFDERRYGDCISECRDLLSMWQRQLKASGDRRVARIVAETRGWLPDDGRERFLDSLWKAAVDLANVPHHPEGQSTDELFEASDARLVLLLTAALSEYLGGLQVR